MALQPDGDFFQSLPEAFLLEVFHRLRDAETVMLVRQCCRKARALARLVESLDLHSVVPGDRPECRMLRIAKLACNIKNLRLVVYNSDIDKPPLSIVFLLSLLEHVSETLVSLDFYATSTNDPNQAFDLPVQVLIQLSTCKRLSRLSLQGISFTGPLTWGAVKAHLFTSLTYLRLIDGCYERTELHCLLRICPVLEHFEVSGPWMDSDDEWSFSGNPKLRTLSLNADPNCSGVVQLPKRAISDWVGPDLDCPPAGLTYLELSSAGTFVTFPDCVRILDKSRNLKYLRLQRCSHVHPNGEAANIAPLIASLQYLRVLELDDDPLVDALFALHNGYNIEGLSASLLPELRELVVRVQAIVRQPVDRLLRFLIRLRKLKSFVLRGKRWSSDQEPSWKETLGPLLAIQRTLPRIELRTDGPVYWPKFD